MERLVGRHTYAVTVAVCIHMIYSLGGSIVKCSSFLILSGLRTGLLAASPSLHLGT
jgi:hypothetical protein